MRGRVASGGAGPLRHRIRASRGMVTAELAVGLLAVIPVAASMIMVAGITATQVKVVEAAREGARSMARGDTDASVRAGVIRILPDAAVTTSRDGGMVTITVNQSVGGRGLVPRFALSASATATQEAGVAGEG